MRKDKILATAIERIDAITDRVDRIKKEAILEINNIRDQAIGAAVKEAKKESMLASSLCWPLWAKSAVEIKAYTVIDGQTREIAQTIHFFPSEEPDWEICSSSSSFLFDFSFYTKQEFWKFETKPVMVDPSKIITNI